MLLAAVVVAVAVGEGGVPTRPLAVARLVTVPPRFGLIHKRAPVGPYANTVGCVSSATYTVPPTGFTAMNFGATAVLKDVTTLCVIGSTTRIFEEATLAT